MFPITLSLSKGVSGQMYDDHPLKWFDGLTMSGKGAALPLTLSLSKGVSGQKIGH